MSFFSNKKRRGILFIINDFNVGGAELFVLRLGKALSKHYDIYVMDIFPDQSNILFKQKFEDAGFKYIPRFLKLSAKREKLYWKLNAFYTYLGKKGVYSLLKKNFESKQLVNQIKKEKIRFLHSHYYSADTLTNDFLKNDRLKWILTMHGGYNQKVYQNLDEIAKKQFIENGSKNVMNCDALTYVADVNLDFLNEFNLKPNKIQKIRLGLDNKESVINNTNEDKPFTFCMVARSDIGKGWEEMLEAFTMVQAKFPSIRIFCVGPLEGIIGELSEKYKARKEIIFTGYTDSPLHFVQQSDVCVLPTYFDGESSPYSIIEYLSCRKPVIATKKGEIPDMITEKGEIAGILLDLNKDGKPSTQDLSNAMEKLMTNKQFYNEVVELTPKVFEKFTMEHCEKEYMKLYNILLTDNYNF